MLPRLVALAAILAVLALYLVWSARRLDRLHDRVDAAAAALDARLVRRATAAAAFCDSAVLPAATAAPVRAAVAAAAAVRGLGHDREVAENALTRALQAAARRTPSSAAGPAALAALDDEMLRAAIARGFYNDTVRDALVVRDRRVVRWLRLAGRAPHPAYFEMDDGVLAAPRISVAGGPTVKT